MRVCDLPCLHLPWLHPARKKGCVNGPGAPSHPKAASSRKCWRGRGDVANASARPRSRIPARGWRPMALTEPAASPLPLLLSPRQRRHPLNGHAGTLSHAQRVGMRGNALSIGTPSPVYRAQAWQNSAGDRRWPECQAGRSPIPGATPPRPAPLP